MACSCAKHSASWPIQRTFSRPIRANHQLCRATGDELISWVRENGGKVWKGVRVSPTDSSGLGLFTSQACAPGQELIWLPRSCQLSYGTATAPALSKIIERIPPSFWGLRLAVKVLEERAKSDSHFVPYIQTLPAVIPGLPMFFSAEAIKELWYPPLVSEVSRRGRFMFEFHRDVIAPLNGTPEDPFDGVGVDLSGMGWALGVVTSRAFAADGPGQPRSLLPLIDIANHSFSRKNCDIDKRQGGNIVLLAKAAIPEGSELLLTYGALDNHTLLLDYGFMDPDNPYDNILLAFDIEQLLALMESATGRPQTLAGWQKQLLLQAKLIGDNAKLAMTVGRGSAASGELPVGVDPRLIVAARILCSSSSEAAQGCGKDTQLAQSNAAALVLVHQYLRLLFSGLGLNALRDQEKMSQPGLQLDLKTAAQLRLYKALLCEEVLSKIQTAAGETCRKLGIDGHSADLTLKALLDVTLQE